MIRQDAEKIWQEILERIKPGDAVARALEQLPLGDKLHVVAVGKAAWHMAKAAQNVLADRIKQGIVITKYHHTKGDIPGFTCYEAGHPVPDENSYRATRAALKLTEDLTEEDTVLLLLSGGGSALFEDPLVSPEEMQDVTEQLLASGADIVEINTLRKRLSRVKGGRFAMCCAPAKVCVVVLSDVLGDRLDMIASGPAYPDSSTCREALSIVEKYGLQFPDSVLRHLAVETPKEITNAEHHIIGSVGQLCRVASEVCEKFGYRPILLTDSLQGQAREAGRWLGGLARQQAQKGEKVALLAGGETVVKVTGNGKGGRNQELAIAACPEIAGCRNVALFSLGSDGTDGPTEAAGGCVDGRTLEKLEQKGLSISEILQNNDAYHGLLAVDGLIVTGPTGTNINDIAIALISP